MEMPKKPLERYNHLRYHAESPSKEDFVDFLYEKTEIVAPGIDVHHAWNKFGRSLNRSEKKSFEWWKVAASVALVVGAVFIWNITSTPEELSVVSGNQKIEVTFPDGSSGILNRNSSFSFPEKFGDTRLVRFRGEAYFDIKKSEKPFTINTGEVDVKVLGTAFNLVTTDNEVELYVDRGLVAFEKEGQQTKVEAGLVAVFNIDNGNVKIIDAPPVNIMSWRNGIFEFDNTPLEEVLNDLFGYYQFDYKFQNSKIGRCKITATFDKDTLSEIIGTIESVLEIKIVLKDKEMKVSGKGC